MSCHSHDSPTVKALDKAHSGVSCAGDAMYVILHLPMHCPVHACIVQDALCLCPQEPCHYVHCAGFPQDIAWNRFVSQDVGSVPDLFVPNRLPTILICP
eukprot:329107-Chlamydomonas_euryale.AAC.22